MHSYHSNATTNIRVRELLKDNPDGQTCRALALRFGISAATACKWRAHCHHRHCMDASSRPRRIRCAFSPEEQQIILQLRTSAKLSLDALLETIEPEMPHATRSSVYRLLKRHGLEHLGRGKLKLKTPQAQAQDAAAPGSHGCFTYKDEGRPPGFVHIDNFLLPCVPGQSNRPSARQRGFVAVDRATRMALVRLYPDKSGVSACDFLDRCRAFFPFAIETILTDNGGEFTLKGVAPVKYYKSGGRAAFEEKCQSAGIRHKTIQPYRPQTNGLVERLNGLIQQATTRKFHYPNLDNRTQAIAEWIDNYNFKRKHRKIPIGKMTPFDAACKWHRQTPQMFPAGKPNQHILRSILKNCSQRNDT